MAASDIDGLLGYLKQKMAMCAYAIEHHPADITGARRFSEYIAAVEKLRVELAAALARLDKMPDTSTCKYRFFVDSGCDRVE